MTRKEFNEEIVEHLVSLGEMTKERAEELVEMFEEDITRAYADGENSRIIAEEVLDKND